MKQIKNALVTASWVIAATCINSAFAANEKSDPYLWLEDVEGERALEWVKKQNDVSLKHLKSLPEFSKFYEQNLAAYQSNEQIPFVTQKGKYLYNFWQDENNVRGIYRRTTLTEYKKDKPKWETVFDLDEISKRENENWVYKGIQCLKPAEELCLLQLSRGGADAVVIREFNLKSKKFVKNGFFIAENKTNVSWLDKNNLYVSTKVQEGDLTDSGYPRVTYLWTRGSDIEDAQLIYAGDKSSIGIFSGRTTRGKDYLDTITDFLTLFETKTFIRDDNKLIELDKPNSARYLGFFKGHAFITLKNDWKYRGKKYTSGSVLYASLDSVIAGSPAYKILLSNTPNKSLDGIRFTKNTILVNWMADVKNELERFHFKRDGSFTIEKVDLPKNGSIAFQNTTDVTDDFMVSFNDFLTPTSLILVNGQTLKTSLLKQLPAFFDASKYESQQYFATSKDGTKVPYYVISAKNQSRDGKNPTLLYGYGGFEVPLLPFYSSTVGTNWLEAGGTYVLANIRGGGEYGPAWHQAALKQNRHKAYEDFEAIAKDLIAKNITSPKHLGIRGGSNGGLLVGAMLSRSPELFNAVVCQVPLLDMLRYHKLLAGASWVGEYGNPDIPEEREYLASYSPYHNLKEGVDYPRAFFTTSTRDDRVHPGHARKMVAKMKDMGIDVFYYENMEGGHGGAANKQQSAYLNALTYAYLLNELK